MSPVLTDIQLRKGTASQWTAVNPIMKTGEPGVETDTGRIKIGDGIRTWSALAYSDALALLAAAAASAMAADAIPLDQRGAAEGGATLGADSKVLMSQILTDVPDGLVTLGENGLIPMNKFAPTTQINSGIITDVVSPIDANWTVSSQWCVRYGGIVYANFTAYYHGAPWAVGTPGQPTYIGRLRNPYWYPVKVGLLNMYYGSKPVSGSYAMKTNPGEDALLASIFPPGTASLVEGDYFSYAGMWMASDYTGAVSWGPTPNQWVD